MSVILTIIFSTLQIRKLSLPELTQLRSYWDGRDRTQIQIWLRPKETHSWTQRLRDERHGPPGMTGPRQVTPGSYKQAICMLAFSQGNKKQEHLMGPCRHWLWITPKKNHNVNIPSKQNLLVLFISDSCLYFLLPCWVRVASRRPKKHNTPPSPTSVS